MYFRFIGFQYREEALRFLEALKERFHHFGLELNAELRRRLHNPIPEVGQWLRSALLGHYRYYGIATALK